MSSQHHPPPSVLRETPGASWEKRGNTVWVHCGPCASWFPVAVTLLRAEAVPACCPRCHRAIKIV